MPAPPTAPVRRRGRHRRVCSFGPAAIVLPRGVFVWGDREPPRGCPECPSCWQPNA
ncbi:MAG: hypothetical protein AVDCRST_MAG73-3790 [uncultured Thermomicrobiales bacterium]|uniref:Uncharacterized protein n=1 Tax=uncultured Thermomicrobiales bacterium TaxID=1645740 RepID=A0A6J4UWK2_9BACT|nr:MAG: hypothetical protein AVDCRST_MAG73-3790 [uncultured Thermomicrobiales bacterium]